MTASDSRLALPNDPSARDPWVGLDIGGANLKAAHTSGWSHSVRFAMWKESRTLAKTLAYLLADCPAFVGVAVTMTGELADCFATRAEGVAIILEQLTSLLPASMVRIYCVDGKWKSVSQSARDPWSAAASNWHALARYWSRFVGTKACLLIDVGSTTTDLIPIRNGMIDIDSKTDSQRLQSGTLVYTGVERSNVVGVVSDVLLYGAPCPLMNEQFATMQDVYLWLGELDEDPSNCDTADGRPATRDAARYRLARIVGEDGSTLADTDIDQMVANIATSQTSLIAKAIMKLATMKPASASKVKKKRASGTAPMPLPLSQATSNPSLGFDCVGISGHGDFLIDAALAACGWDGERIRMRERIGPELARCAPAYAIAMLASEELQPGVTD